MKRILILLLGLHAKTGFMQTISLNTVCTFAAPITESSGLLFIDSTHVITHNDSGDSARVFLYNYSSCSIEKQIKIINHVAVDIESITMDDSGYVYIADFGNNLGNRTNLVILKVPLADVLMYDSVTVQKIVYSYADQLSFSASSTHNFDCEAFVHANDSLFLFSKNHGMPGTYCKRYALPDLPGTYSVLPIDSIALPTWVTDAAIDTSGKKFVLNSELHLYVFKMGNAVPVFDSLEFTLNYSFISQKEGVAFDNHNHLLVTDELFSDTGGKLYEADLTGYIAIKEQNTNAYLPVIYQNGELNCVNALNEAAWFNVYTLDGKILFKKQVYPGELFRYKPAARGILVIDNNSYHQSVKF